MGKLIPLTTNYKLLQLTIIPQAHVGYKMIDSQ